MVESEMLSGRMIIDKTLVPTGTLPGPEPRPDSQHVRPLTTVRQPRLGLIEYSRTIDAGFKFAPSQAAKLAAKA